MNRRVMDGALFTAGDYLGGALLGGMTAAAVRMAIGPETDMVVAMLAGMGIGMVLHVVVGLLLTPLLGVFHVMVSGGLIGMYGGMMFAMRDSMQTHAMTLHHVIAVGVVFGLVMSAAIHLYDHALRGPAAAPRS